MSVEAGTSRLPPAGQFGELTASKHVSFLLRCLRMLPAPYTSADDQRMTLGYFALAGLDLLHATHKVRARRGTRAHRLGVRPAGPEGGFRGSPSTPFTPATAGRVGSANIAMTYSALLILAILRDDYTRLDRTRTAALHCGAPEREWRIRSRTTAEGREVERWIRIRGSPTAPWRCARCWATFRASTSRRRRRF